MLLSRLAENVHWLGRYLERAESTARIVSVHANQFFDLPVGADPGWHPLLAITSSDELFCSLYGYASAVDAQEADVISFLVTDTMNPSSVVSTLTSARLNLRATRALVPREAWEVLNNLWLYATDEADAARHRHGRHRYLSRVVGESQKIAGLLHGTMSRDLVYTFLTIGVALERADMTTRVLDVRAESMQAERSHEPERFDEVLWMGALRSLSAFQMYRRTVPAHVQADNTLRFLLQDHQFPRSVAHCLDEISSELKGLTRNTECLEACDAATVLVADAPVDTMDLAAVHAFADTLQGALAAIETALSAQYFRSAS